MRHILFFCFLLSNLFSYEQVVQPSDSLKLPFAIAKEKRLSDDDLKDKKEGVYLTGEPDLSSDPEHGFGAGAEAQFYIDGKRTDPFFAYTPYRAEIDLSAFYTTKSEREFDLVWDVPYIFDSQWRFRGACVYEIDPDHLFFGVTENSLKPLNYYPGNDSSKTPVNNASFNDYSNNQVGSIANYNAYQQQEKSLAMSLEHSWFEGKLRTLIGYEFDEFVTTTPLDNNSLLHEQAIEGLITGYGASRTGEAKIGVAYDTRDLEHDPSNGTFAEITNQVASTALGSNFNYDRVFIHYNYYHRLFPQIFKRVVFAGRVGLGYTTGNAPFYEYLDQWSSEGDVDGLGGPNTLRGYTESRFAAPVMFLANIELRCRFWETDILKQHLAFYVIPFLDAGGVWNSLNRITNLQNLRFSEGPGMQIAWDEDTILRFDYGISPEGGQFYFGIEQIF